MKDPARPDSIPCEEADFMKGKYLDLFIDSCIDMDTSFKVTPTKAAKQATKNGREGVSFVYMKFHHYEMNGQPPCFSREVDSFTRSTYDPFSESKEMAAFVKYKEKEAKAESLGVFIIRGDGRAESLKAFQQELRATVKTPTER